MSFSAGEIVGPYRIIEQLGQGGMASVYKAYHPALDRFVAIKVLHPAFKEDPNFLSRFQREARVVARLEHPHIVPIYDFAEHEGQPYLVMKYIEGVTLKARLAERPLTRDEAVEIVDAVGAALAYAHQQGVLHRDIKPSNILLSPDGGIYLADFGLARIAEAGASTLSKDVMLGTPQYISPEQARGMGDLDEGTDVYSLGVVLYEIVVGRVPFNADTPFSIIHDHIYTPLPPPSTVNPHVPPRVEAVLMKALEKSRPERYPDVPTLVKAFRGAVLGLESDGTEPISTTRKLGAPTRVARTQDDEAGGSESPGSPDSAAPGKRRRWLWVVAGIGLTLVCLFVFLVVASRADRANRAAAGATTTVPGEQVAVATLAPGLLQNPDRHFERAQQLLEAGYSLLAAEEFTRAGELYLRAARYTDAAGSFMKGYQANPNALQRSRETPELATEAFFMAAADPKAGPIIEEFMRAGPDMALITVIHARMLLFQNKIDEARAELSRVLDQEPDQPYALAVMAEILLRSGEQAEAERIIQKELSQPDAMPPWLFEHVKRLQPGS